MLAVSGRLPDFPWDTIIPYREKALSHPDGLIDLSVGTPVDSVPPTVQAALASAADSPGYPYTVGSPALRAALTSWVRRRCEAADGFDVLPTIGSKELVAWLPTLLGLGPDDVVVVPELAYPTYEVGARLAGCRIVRTDTLTSLGPERVGLVWLNSPSNPTGQVLGAAHLRKVVDWARERGAVVASDECYLELGWTANPTSVLSVCGEDFTGVLSVHSLSKRSNLAGYRAGFVAGDAALVGELLAVRKHAGMIVSAPVQAAMVAALDDDEHVAQQRALYAERRDTVRAALRGAGFSIEHSEAGLYLWATRGDDCWDTLDWLAGHGILAAPGAFYGPTGKEYVRIALTATSAEMAEVAARFA